MPRRKAIIETGDLPNAPPELNEAGFHASDIQVVKERDADHKIREEKFMNEKIVIEIEPGTQENDPVYVQLGHNGITQMVKRGEEQIVKRKFLYSALMARKVSINCDFRKGNDGKEINKLTPNAATTYRARLVSDNNPQGGSRWVQSVMSEATGLRM